MELDVEAIGWRWAIIFQLSFTRSLPFKSIEVASERTEYYLRIARFVTLLIQRLESDDNIPNGESFRELITHFKDENTFARWFITERQRCIYLALILPLRRFHFQEIVIYRPETGRLKLGCDHRPASQWKIPIKLK